MQKFNTSLREISLLLISVLFFSCSSANNAIAPSELNKVLSQAKAGDTIILKNGTWSDVNLKIKAQATAEAPIIIKAQDNGQVILTGQSTLKIGGSYVTVEGLFFQDGLTNGDPVIVFKEGGRVADHCRLTACSVSNYNPENRFQKSDWVLLYGQRNRIDHCTFEGKYNGGLMVAVKLSGVESQNNHHQIDHNHFLNRPRLGSNGGETVRIGTSTNSLEPAHVQFTDNYFENCAGEVEILSVKSTENVVSGNVFYECEGVLALRHGNSNVVTNNTFIGNGKPNTGGIRVINAGHTITNNHFQDLTGFRFWSALAVMNGVPNSAINRYHQVKDVKISSNTFVNCKNIGFSVGTDNERTALPENVEFSNNTIYSKSDQKIHFLDDASGITFKNNKVSKSVQVDKPGFEVVELKGEKDDCGKCSIYDAPKAQSVSKEDCGASWFGTEKEAAHRVKAIIVNSGEELEKAISTLDNGDEIICKASGVYQISELLLIDKKIKLIGASDADITIEYSENTGDPLVVIAEGGDLTLEGLKFNGLTNGKIAPCAIRTQVTPFLTQYNLRVKNCHFFNFNAGGRTVFSATPTSYADTVLFEDCKFSNISGVAINLKAEKDDVGRYNAENVILKNCLFYDVMGSAIALYRGGNDESTSGPKLTIDQCTFYNVENRELGSSINVIGAQKINITNCIFSESGKSGRVIKSESPEWAPCTIDYCNFYNVGRIETFYNTRLGKNVWKVDPQFKSSEDADFTLKPSSPLLSKSSKSNALGYK